MIPFNLKPICSFLFLLLASWSICAQNAYPVSEIPDPLVLNAESVVRQDQTTIHIKSPGEANLSRRHAVTYLRTGAQTNLDLVLSEGRFTKIRSMKVVVYDAAGQVVQESKRSAVQEFGNFSASEFTDQHYRVISVPEMHPPFTVEYSYEMDFQDFFLLPDWSVQNIGQSVEHLELTIFCPADYKFSWKGVRTDIPIVRDNEKGSWRWATDHLKALPQEPGQPYFNGRYAYLVFAPEIFAFGDHRGSLRDWRSFGQFVYDLNNFPSEVSPALAQQVLSLVAPCRNEQEKIAVLYRFLQENTRYVSVQIGTGGWQAFDAAYVEKKRYGDCKALSNYMRALLKVAGIPSWLALVYGDEDGAPEVFADIADPGFNHMILYVPSSQTWLECTSNDLPAGYLGTFTNARQALLLTPKGGELINTPQLTEKENRKNLNADIRFQDDGTAQVNCRGTLNGALQESYRYLVSVKSEEEIARYFMEHAGFQVVKIDRLKFLPAADRPAVLFNYQVEASGLATKSGKRMFVNLGKMTPLAPPALPLDSARVHGLSIRQGLSVQDTLNVSIPANYAVENMPAETQITTAFGSYQRKFILDAGKITVIRSAVFLPVNVPSEQYNAVRQFYTDVTKADTRQLVLIRKD